MHTIEFKEKAKELYVLNSSERSLVRELKYIYYAEKKMLRLFFRMERSASTRYLKACFNGHITATTEHITRLENIFQILGQKPASGKCSVIEEFSKHASMVIRISAKNTLSRDLGLITLAEKIEAFEVRKYNELISLANDLGNFKIVFLLEETLLEEQEAAETFLAVKEDTFKDERFKPSVHEGSEKLETEEPEVVEENV